MDAVNKPNPSPTCPAGSDASQDIVKFEPRDTASERVSQTHFNGAVFAALVAATLVFTAAPADAQGVQCTDFVRGRLAVTQPAKDFSALKGNAGEWAKAATKAVGSKAVTKTPSKGAIMVFAGSGDKASYAQGTKFAAGESGHVAIVAKVSTSTEITVDHANWRAGKTDLNVPVKTTDSWKTASVWNLDTKAWGGGKYAVAGFIDPSKFPTKKK